MPDFFNLDIGFISGEEGIDGAFVFEVKLVAVVSGSLDIVKDGLIGEVNAPDIAEHVGGFSGGDGIGDVEGKDEGKDIQVVMDSIEVDFGLNGGSHLELVRLEVVVS